MLRLYFKLQFRLFAHASDTFVFYEKPKFVCFICLQVKITFFQINMKQVLYMYFMQKLR